MTHVLEAYHDGLPKVQRIVILQHAIATAKSEAARFHLTALLLKVERS